VSRVLLEFRGHKVLLVLKVLLEFRVLKVHKVL
jgi:hypothetical protein